MASWLRSGSLPSWSPPPTSSLAGGSLPDAARQNARPRAPQRKRGRAFPYPGLDQLVFQGDLEEREDVNDMTCDSYAGCALGPNTYVDLLAHYTL